MTQPTHQNSLESHQAQSATDGNSSRGTWREYQQQRLRKMALPVFLFVVTCLSCFWVGITDWNPTGPFESISGERLGERVLSLFLENWQQGLIYSACVLAILLTHELGHFIATIVYRVRATAPIFIPFPLNPIGTLGAVIAMESSKANRRQIFDIGIAGPLAGLVVAVPIALVGISQLDLTTVAQGQMGYRCPLLFQWLMSAYDVPGYTAGQSVWVNQLNPYFAAAWVGFLITGLNMFPIGQLDGGHVTYTLFGKIAHPIADATMVLWIAYMVCFNSFVLLLMVALLLLFGTKHPPTADDSVPIGPARFCLGLASLAIPFLCFPPGIFDLSFPSF